MNVQQTVELPICSANAPLPFPHYHRHHHLRHHHSHHYYHSRHPPQTHPTQLKKNDNGCFIFLVASVVLKPTWLATAQTNVWLFVVCASCPMSRNTNTQTCKSSQLVVLEEGVCSMLMLVMKHNRSQWEWQWQRLSHLRIVFPWCIFNKADRPTPILTLTL